MGVSVGKDRAIYSMKQQEFAFPDADGGVPTSQAEAKLNLNDLGDALAQFPSRDKLIEILTPVVETLSHPALPKAVDLADTWSKLDKILESNGRFSERDADGKPIGPKRVGEGLTLEQRAAGVRRLRPEESRPLIKFIHQLEKLVKEHVAVTSVAPKEEPVAPLATVVPVAAPASTPTTTVAPDASIPVAVTTPETAVVPPVVTNPAARAPTAPSESEAPAPVVAPSLMTADPAASTASTDVASAPPAPAAPAPAAPTVAAAPTAPTPAALPPAAPAPSATATPPAPSAVPPAATTITPVVPAPTAPVGPGVPTPTVTPAATPASTATPPAASPTVTPPTRPPTPPAAAVTAAAGPTPPATTVTPSASTPAASSSSRWLLGIGTLALGFFAGWFARGFYVGSKAEADDTRDKPAAASTLNNSEIPWSKYIGTPSYEFMRFANQEFASSGWRREVIESQKGVRKIVFDSKYPYTEETSDAPHKTTHYGLALTEVSRIHGTNLLIKNSVIYDVSECGEAAPRKEELIPYPALSSGSLGKLMVSADGNYLYYFYNGEATVYPVVENFIARSVAKELADGEKTVTDSYETRLQEITASDAPEERSIGSVSAIRKSSESPRYYVIE